MQVKVKKEVLFNLIKKTLLENRTFDNPSGNFIHSFDRQEAPIEAIPHMSNQISVEEPPVGDENYVPASIRELRAAAARIAEEVPPDQVETYYRNLHRLLDNVIDKSNESGMMSEAWDLEWKGSGWEDTDYADDDEYGSVASAGGNLEDVMSDQSFIRLKREYEKDPFYDGTQEIQDLADKYSVGYSDIESMLMSSDSSDQSKIATMPTPTSASSRSRMRSADRARARTAPTIDDEDLPELSDEDEERLLGQIGDDKLERSPEVRQHKALTRAYWESALEDLKSGERYPLEIMSQVVMDSMDAVSRVIGTEVSVKYGFGGGDPNKEFTGSNEERAWSGILSNGINTNSEVVYRLPADKKTPEFWKPIVTAFMSRLQSRRAGSLSEYSSMFQEMGSLAFEKYNQESGLGLQKFLEQITNRVVDSILYHPQYGALTRNVASSEEELLSRLIDTGFSAQIKKSPFNIPTKATFKARKLDPSEEIEHAGTQKTLKQGIVDAVVAYVIVKSDEFKTQRRQLDADLSNEDRDQAIQSIIESISGNETFTYTSGSSSAKASFVITKEDIVDEVNAYVDQKFSESSVEDAEIEEPEEIGSETERMLEDPNIPNSEKKERFTDEVASQIMRNTGSVASYRDYVNRVLNKKVKMALEGLEEGEGDTNFIGVFNDTLAEIIPAVEEALMRVAQEGQRQGLSEEELNPFIEAIAQIRGVKEFVYSPETLGGERTIQNLEDGIFNIGGETYNAGEFFAEGQNPGPAILRYVVSDLIGTSLKGAGLQNIETINFAFEKKVKRLAENIEDHLKNEMLRMFSGINLGDAQNAANITAAQIGHGESKAKFLEPNGRDLQIKTIYPFVGRVKRLPDFSKMNPAAKNYVCWFSAIADKRYGGAATEAEKVAVAKELYDKLMRIGSGEIDTASSDVEDVANKTSDVINRALSEVEAIEDFTQKEVKRIRQDPKLMEKIVKQAMKMHLEDVDYPDF